MISTKLTTDFIQGCHKRYKKDNYKTVLKYTLKYFNIKTYLSFKF